VLAESLEADHRLVTLLGPGGIGKTRLAVQHAVSREAEERVLFAELSGATNAAEICSAVARALDVAIDGGVSNDDLADDLGASLASVGPSFLILDNAERAVEPCASLLGAWLDAAPDLRVLVTSRSRLGLRAETTIVLGPLDPKGTAGVELFLDRASRARPTARPADDALVSDLVERLDGWPLALELAAARLSVLSLGDLARGLGQRFSLLRGTERDRTARHRTLEETIRWSWDLLDAGDRDVLMQCSVFRDGFTLAAARAIVVESGPQRLLDALEALADHSLIRAEPSEDEGQPIRYRMYESIREFAAARAEAAQLSSDLSHRHAVHFATTSRALLAGAKTASALVQARAALAADLDNLATALEWASRDPRGTDLALGAALGLAAVYAARGPNESYLAVLDRAIACVGESKPSAELVRALLTRADAKIRHGAIADARADLERAGSLAGTLGDAAVSGRVVLGRATWAWVQGLLDESEREAEIARGLATDAGDAALEALAVDELARIAVLRGQVDRAQELAKRSVDLHHRLGDDGGAARALFTQAEVAMDLGDLSRARSLHDRVVELSRTVDDVRMENAAQLSLAALDEAEGRFEDADARFESCIRLVRRAGTRGGESLVLAYRGACFEHAGKTAEARGAYADAIDIARSSANRLVEGLALAWFGRLHADADEIDEAEQCLERAVALLDQIGDEVRAMVVELCRKHVDLARARSMSSSDPDAARALRHAVAERIAEIDAGKSVPSFDVRAAADRLREALARERPSTISLPPHAMSVASDGKWFREAGGRQVDIARHGAPCLLLAALARQHRAAPGTPISVEALFAAGWPGQRAHPRSASARVYTAVSTLRRLGLRSVLVRHHDGYLLDRRVQISVVDGET
jgi:predicted ATPase